MKKQASKFRKIILPKRKLNIFITSIIILGVILGSLFLLFINKEDKSLVINQITNFFTNINNDKLNLFDAFKNSIISNFMYLIVIFVLGLSIIGIPLVIFLVFFKGFIFGFSISSIILVYNYKGIIGSLLYVFPHHIINLIILIIIGVYSVSFSKNLLESIFKRKNISYKNILKRYLIILIIALVTSVITSSIEVFISPLLIKLCNFLFV